ncbi:MAG TPA: hypothetical protein VFE53_25945 [Mucilaginibacter sp.]|jgi:hypothetical protein|nr:hypothetical protein [Mucilaginibacter sp.]
MKKPYSIFKFLSIAAAAFFFFSCTKKSNQNPVSVTLTGKWNITADTSQTFGYPPYIIVGINSPYMQFNADGSGTEKDNISTPDWVLSFTYKISKDTISFNYPVQTGLPSGNTPTGIIKELTSNNVIIEYDINDPTLTVKERVYMSR